MDCATMCGRYIVGHYEDLIAHIDLKGNNTGVVIVNRYLERNATQRNAVKRAVFMDKVLIIGSPRVVGVRQTLKFEQ